MNAMRQLGVLSSEAARFGCCGIPGTIGLAEILAAVSAYVLNPGRWTAFLIQLDRSMRSKGFVVGVSVCGYRLRDREEGGLAMPGAML